MRSFIIACSILTVAVLTVILNSLYITHKAHQLISICDSIDKENSAESSESLLTEWRSCKGIFALTTHASDIIRIDDALLSLQLYKPGTPEFQYHLKILRATLQQIYSSEKFSFGMIF